MKAVLITGAGGLIGSEAVAFFSDKFDLVIGVDNNMRQYFFGEAASTDWNRQRLQADYSNYRHYAADIRDVAALTAIFAEYGADIALVVHTAAQPSHDASHLPILASTPRVRSICWK
jgi:CDP-paratose 2-epimerase